jgi:hypothetical protein
MYLSQVGSYISVLKVRLKCSFSFMTHKQTHVAMRGKDYRIIWQQQQVALFFIVVVVEYRYEVVI